MGKEHCGKETDTGYGKREDKRERALTLNCRKTHESGDNGDVHGDLLCVDFEEEETVEITLMFW